MSDGGPPAIPCEEANGHFLGFSCFPTKRDLIGSCRTTLISMAMEVCKRFSTGRISPNVPVVSRCMLNKAQTLMAMEICKRLSTGRIAPDVPAIYRCVLNKALNAWQMKLHYSVTLGATMDGQGYQFHRRGSSSLPLALSLSQSNRNTWLEVRDPQTSALSSQELSPACIHTSQARLPSHDWIHQVARWRQSLVRRYLSGMRVQWDILDFRITTNINEYLSD